MARLVKAGTPRALPLIGMDLTFDQARQLIGQPRCLHLQMSLARAGTPCKDFQDQRAAIYDRQADFLFQIPRLNPCQFVDKHCALRALRFAALLQFRRFSRTDQGPRMSFQRFLRQPRFDLNPASLTKQRRFIQFLRPALIRFPGSQSCQYR